MEKKRTWCWLAAVLATILAAAAGTVVIFDSYIRKQTRERVSLRLVTEAEYTAALCAGLSDGELAECFKRELASGSLGVLIARAGGEHSAGLVPAELPGVTGTTRTVLNGGEVYATQVELPDGTSFCRITAAEEAESDYTFVRSGTRRLCAALLGVLVLAVAGIAGLLHIEQRRQRLRSSIVEAELRTAAQTDGATGLLNKCAANELVSRELRDGTDVMALLIADLDDFKQINDTLGHAQGDIALTEVAGVLRSHFRCTDVVARIGGDEFMVLLRHAGGEEQLRGTVTQLIAKLALLRVGEKRDYPVRGSIGIALSQPGDTFERLFCRADTALYHVKRCGKNGSAFYSPSMETD